MTLTDYYAPEPREPDAPLPPAGQLLTVWLLAMILALVAVFGTYQWNQTTNHKPCVDGSYGNEERCRSIQNLRDCLIAYRAERIYCEDEAERVREQ